MAEHTEQIFGLLSSEDALSSLQRAVRGLLYPSESDKPITVVSLKRGPAASLAGSDMLVAALQELGKVPVGAVVQPLSVDALFAGPAQDQAWFGLTEQAVAQRFRDLLALLRRLDGATAFRVAAPDPGAPINAFALGITADGDIAGVATQLVET